MSQAAFIFDRQPAAPASAGVVPAARAHAGGSGPADAIGLQIGWDHAHYRLTPPLAHLHADNPVRQGWSAGRSAYGSRTLPPTPAVRQWLGLRLHAWAHGHEYEDVQATPHLLAQLAVECCPVTGQPLTRDRPAPTDAVITRANPAAAFAAGNLLMVSQQARAALDTLDRGAAVAQALAHARTLDAAGAATVAGLDAAAWWRAASLIALATPLPHADAAAIALRVLPPNRLRVVNPIQALQVTLTLLFCAAGWARSVTALAALMPSGAARRAYQVFMHTLLARRLDAGPTLAPRAARQALERAWADKRVQLRWQHLAQHLTAGDCEQLLQRASAKGMVPVGARWLSAEHAIDGWAIERAGQWPATVVADGTVSEKPLSH